MNTVPTIAEVWEKEYFSQGLAICENHIISDTIYFKFRDEAFEFSTRESTHLVTYDQSGYNHASVAKLRKLKKSKEH